jgi:hypothetical protein
MPEIRSAAIIGPVQPGVAQNQGADRIALFWCRILVQNNPMIYGYARVSTDGQSVDAQVRQLTKAGCKKVFGEVAKSRRPTGRSKRRNQGETLADIARSYNVSPATISRLTA